MKYAVETGSCAMIYIPVFIKTDSVIQKLIEEFTGTQIRIHRDMQAARRSHKPIFIFFK
jgi:hypothetical protein